MARFVMDLARWVLAGGLPGRSARFCVECGYAEECARQVARSFLDNGGQPTTRARWRVCAECSGEDVVPFRRTPKGPLISSPNRWAFSSARRQTRLLHPGASVGATMGVVRATQEPRGEADDESTLRDHMESYDEYCDKVSEVRKHASESLQDEADRIVRQTKQAAKRIAQEFDDDLADSEAMRAVSEEMRATVEFEVRGLQNQQEDHELRQFKTECDVRKLGGRMTAVERDVSALKEAKHAAGDGATSDGSTTNVPLHDAKKPKRKRPNVPLHDAKYRKTVRGGLHAFYKRLQPSKMVRLVTTSRVGTGLSLEKTSEEMLLGRKPWYGD